MDKSFRNWVLFVAFITLFLGAFYIYSHYKIRAFVTNGLKSSSDKMVSELSQGKSFYDVLPQTTFDLTNKVYHYNFIIIFTENGDVATTSALLDGKVPELPKGVLEYTKNNGENKITWEPKTGVREAILVKPYQSSNDQGFVLVGHPLDDAEWRIGVLTKIVGFTWLSVVAISYFVFRLATRKSSLKKTSNKSKK